MNPPEGIGVSLKILFADDSMTAQNMGKKILTDAGYEVVAVSNGAAAVKKIAEHKPDIIILDIYMPGYSGLEVCDKLRASHETMRTPVLLTVGKWEAYKAEDANRVRADGVIIKPFEASDLLAVIKKLEERVVPKKPVPVGDETILLDRPPDFAEFDVSGSENHREMRGHSTVQATVDVPDNMATTAAFSDLLATEPGHSMEPLPVPQYSPAVDASFESSTPSNTVAATVADQATEEHTKAPQVAVVENAGAKVPAASVAEAATRPAIVSAIPDTEPIPVYQEFAPHVEEVSALPEAEPVIAVTAPEPEPEPETDTPAPTGSLDPLSARVEAHVQQIEAIVAASEAHHIEPEMPPRVAENGTAAAAAARAPEPEATASTEDDFEARVQAAMSVYDEPVEEKLGPEPLKVVAEAAPEVEPVHSTTKAAVEPEPARNVVVAAPEPEVVEAPASFEYSPPVTAPAVAVEHDPQPAIAHASAQPIAEETPIDAGPMLVTTEATQVIPVYIEPPSEPTQVIPVYLEPPAAKAPEPPKPAEIARNPEPRAAVPVEPVAAVEEKVAANLEAELPAVAAAVASSSGMDTIMIAGVVDRILDRLKPQLIEEISKELKSKK